MRLPYVSVLLVVLVGTAIAQSQEYKQWQYWQNGLGIARVFVLETPEGEANEIKKRWDDIGDSLKHSSSPYAGTYYQDGNRGYFLRWSPEEGFVYAWYYENYVIDASYGRVKVSPLGVEFTVEREMVNKDAGHTPTHWVPAYDGKFLLQSTQVAEFGRYYGGFGEFNGFRRNWECDCEPFASRVDKEIRFDGKPSFVLPALYSKYIRKPISGNVVFVGKRYISRRPVIENNGENASLTPVILGVGSKDGVTRGLMFFLLPDQEGLHQIVKVTKVSKNTSQAIVIRDMDENHRENFPDWQEGSPNPRRLLYPQIKIGDRITTSFLDNL